VLTLYCDNASDPNGLDMEAFNERVRQVIQRTHGAPTVESQIEIVEIARVPTVKPLFNAQEFFGHKLVSVKYMR